VQTFIQAGEEIAYGNPAVTNQERAATGHETLAERSRAMRERNRRRGAEHYAVGSLPDDQDMLRVWQPRDPAALRTRVDKGPLAVWAEDDILHVLWHGQADEVRLAAGVQARLWPVEGADDLWEASLPIRRLDEAVITIMVLPHRAEDNAAPRCRIRGCGAGRGRPRRSPGRLETSVVRLWCQRSGSLASDCSVSAASARAYCSAVSVRWS
jgi:hypothetical protein